MTHVNVVAGRSRFVFQIAAGIILTVASVCSFLRFQRLFHTKTPNLRQQARNSEPETRNLRYSSTVSAARDF